MGFLFPFFLHSQSVDLKCRQVWVVPYPKAKEVVRGQRFKTEEEFNEWEDRPEYIPKTPDNVYGKEFEGWEEFLGTKWMPVEDARVIAHYANVTNNQEMREWLNSDRRPPNFPPDPSIIYEEWKGVTEFRGTKWMPVEDARVIARYANATNSYEMKEWLKSDRRPPNFPFSPSEVYRGEWRDVAEFQGTKTGWMPVEDARVIARHANVTNSYEMKEWLKSKRPVNFPSRPNRVYGNEWKGVTEFRGTKWMPVEDARVIARYANVTNSYEMKEWLKSDRRPPNFPADPKEVYKSEWRGVAEFYAPTLPTLLNKSNKNRKSIWAPYAIAKEIVRRQNFKSKKEFKEWKDRPAYIPKEPNDVYGEEFEGWWEFLGSKIQWMPVEEARVVARNSYVTNSYEMKEWLKSGRPANFPADPLRVYEEWRGIAEFREIKDKNADDDLTVHLEEKETPQTTIPYNQTETSLSKEEQRDFPTIDDSMTFDDNLSPPTVHLEDKETPKTIIFYKQTGTSPVKKQRNSLTIDDYMTFKEAQDYVISIGIETEKELLKWLLSSDRPKNFPLSPSRIYREQWKGAKDFLKIE